MTEPAAPAGAADGGPGSRSGRPAGRILASCLLGAVAVFVLVIGVAGIVAAATGKPSKPDAVTLVVIFLVAFLAGWGAVAVWRGKGRRRVAVAPGTGRLGTGERSGGRSAGRILFSLLLWAVTAGLVLIGVAGTVSAVTGHGGSGDGGLVFVFLIALFAGSGAVAVARGGRRETAPAFAPVPREYGAGGSGLLASLPAADAAVRYRERCSQFPVTGGIVGGCLLVGSVAGIAVIGANGAAGGIVLTVAVISAIYMIFVLIDLPNGIEIAGGRFDAGVRGVPAAGRLWRRISGPLEAVHSWDVHIPDKTRGPRRQRRAGHPAVRRVQLLGDLRLFSRRQFLRLEVSPASVQAELPTRILLGYMFVDAARAGAVWDGTILIGTRHPAALAAALEQALPGRRAPSSS